MASDEPAGAAGDADPAGPDRAAPAPSPEGRAPEEADTITFEQIRERAYELWERNHRPDGLEIQFWLVAERELRAERDRRLGGRPETADEGT